MNETTVSLTAEERAFIRRVLLVFAEYGGSGEQAKAKALATKFEEEN
ncbi:hypothetical protein [Streptomyces californicus]|nr:hypothetical protein [Streptomyces californicus]QRV53486.1 hypothetical protein I6J40_04195 [Streptomyces californicus]